MLQHQHMVDQLCSRIDSLRLRFSDRPRQRVLVALAGVPGSGKSTISTAVLAGLRARGEEGVMVIPMVKTKPWPLILVSLQNNGNLR